MEKKKTKKKKKNDLCDEIDMYEGQLKKVVYTRYISKSDAVIKPVLSFSVCWMSVLFPEQIWGCKI